MLIIIKTAAFLAPAASTLSLQVHFLQTYPSDWSTKLFRRTNGKRPDGVSLVPWQSELVRFNVPLDTLQIISETVLQAITCTATDNKFHDRAAGRHAGTLLSHAHWLSHTLTEHLMRQAQQQRWLLPGRRTSMLTLAPVTSLSQLRLRPWAFSTHQLATSWLILKGGSGEARQTSYLFQRISVLVQRFNAVLLHDSLPTTDSTDWRSYPPLYCLVNF